MLRILLTDIFEAECGRFHRGMGNTVQDHNFQRVLAHKEIPPTTHKKYDKGNYPDYPDGTFLVQIIFFFHHLEEDRPIRHGVHHAC